MLCLDAAFPPSPAQLVADCQAVGAGAVAPYVYGGYVNYTQAHYSALRAAGILLLPIVVPGDIPPSPSYLVQVMTSEGFSGGSVAVDLEYLSMPPATWVEQLAAALPQYRIGLYGTTGTLGGYPGEAFRWISAWPYPAGAWRPVPDLPLGRDGWQFAHDVNINGSQYDISVIDPIAIFGLHGPGTGGVDDLTPQESVELGEVHTFSYTAANNMNPGKNADGTPTLRSLMEDVHQWAFTAADNSSLLVTLKAELDNLIAHPAVVSSDPQVLTLLQQLRSKFS